MKKTLPLGLTNKITIKDHFFLKKTTKTSDYFIDRENEKSFYLQTQKVDFIKIPWQMEKQLNGRWKNKMEYYPHASTLNHKKYDFKTYQAVKHLIDQLHGLKLNLKIFDPQKFLGLFLKKIGIIDELQGLTDKIQEIILNYYNHQNVLVVSHNDLIADNFLIVNEKMYLIDFEYVSYNHPLFDYASFMTEACNVKQAQAFKKNLNLNPQEEKELENLMLYQNYLWAHWAKYMFNKTKNLVYEKIMKTKIQQALKKSS